MSTNYKIALGAGAVIIVVLLALLLSNPGKNPSVTNQTDNQNSDQQPQGSTQNGSQQGTNTGKTGTTVTSSSDQAINTGLDAVDLEINGMSSDSTNVDQSLNQ